MTPFLRSRERVPDRCIFAVVCGKNVDTNISTRSGISSGPITPGCIPGILLNVNASVKTAPVNCKKINISAKYINPAGCTNRSYDNSQSPKFLPVLIKYANFWYFKLSCNLILYERNPLWFKYCPPFARAAFGSQSPDDGINTESYGNSTSTSSLKSILKNISILSDEPRSL